MLYRSCAIITTTSFSSASKAPAATIQVKKPFIVSIARDPFYRQCDCHPSEKINK
jgi:hypothetical protein